jgi:tripartite-type tricarboxylate transporter receptor subunit TctC
MNLPRGVFLRLVAGGAALAAVTGSQLLATPAWPQAAKVIKIIVPYPPGGAADVVARTIADQVGKLQGPTMVVENRPGAGTVIGSEDVLRSAPDGTTLLFTNNSTLLVAHLRKLDFDPLSSFVPICNIAVTPAVVIVAGSSPYQTLGDLIAAARAKPNDLTFAAALGAVSHVGFEMLLHAANVQMRLIPYPGTPQQTAAVMAGQVDTALVEYPTSAGLVRAGKLRAIAVGSPRRFTALPDVPTIAESGFKDYEMELWYGFLAPAKTPQPAVAALTDWFAKAVQAPEARARFAAQGTAPSGACGAMFGAYLRKQYDDYGRAIREANIQAE